MRIGRIVNQFTLCGRCINGALGLLRGMRIPVVLYQTCHAVHVQSNPGRVTYGNFYANKNDLFLFIVVVMDDDCINSTARE